MTIPEICYFYPNTFPVWLTDCMRISPLTYLPLICLVFISLSCQKNETKVGAEKLSKKRIKTIMETIHDPIEQDGGVNHTPEISENSFINKTYFDLSGNVLARDQFNSAGIREFRTTFKYNEKGNLIERTGFQFKMLTRRKVNKFNAPNNLIEINTFDENGKNSGRTTFIRDGNGKTMRMVYALKKATLVKTSVTYYDEKDHQIETQYFTDTRLTGRELYRYDDRWNLIENSVQYPIKNEEQHTHFKYDSLNNKIETTVLNGSMMIESKVLTRYDERGNIVELTSYGIKGNIKERIMHRYEYDQENNWIKDITFANKKPRSVTIRKIEYY